MHHDLADLEASFLLSSFATKDPTWGQLDRLLSESRIAIYAVILNELSGGFQPSDLDLKNIVDQWHRMIRINLFDAGPRAWSGPRSAGEIA